MDPNSFISLFQKIYRVILGLLVAVFVLFFVVIYLHYDPNLSAFQTQNKVEANTQIPKEKKKGPEIVDGIHVETGLKEGEGLKTVIATCTACHSAKLVTQNRATKEGWISMIRWMQETQNLWELGESEEIIVSYLANNYAPEKKGRRQNLQNIEWYELE